MAHLNRTFRPEAREGGGGSVWFQSDRTIHGSIHLYTWMPVLKEKILQGCRMLLYTVGWLVGYLVQGLYSGELKMQYPFYSPL